MKTAALLPSATALTLAALGGSASAEVPQNVYEPSSPATDVLSAAVSCASGGTAGSPAPLDGHGAAAVPAGVGTVIGGTVGLGVAAGLAVNAGVGLAVGVGGPQHTFGNVGVGVAGAPDVQPARAAVMARPAAST